MDFSLREEQRDAQGLASRIFADQVTVERLKALDSSGYRFDESLWHHLAESGLLGVAIDEAWGGSGLGFETLCLLLTEAGKAVAPVPLLPVLVSAALPLQRFAGDALREALLPDLVAGRSLITAALVEPGNDDMLNPRAEARADGDGWVIDGVKHMVALADRARYVLLAARTDSGPVVVLVDPQASGVVLSAQHSTAGEPQSAMVLAGVRVPPEQVVVSGERARALLAWTRQLTLTGIAAQTLGVCEKMLAMTAIYTSERQQFGVPIATFQAVSHRAADAYIDVASLRLVTEQAAALLDQGEDAAEAVTIAKIWTGDVAHRVSQAAQHLHGGIGVDRDYALFRYCLWAKELELRLGGSSVYLTELGEGIANWAKCRAGLDTTQPAQVD